MADAAGFTIEQAEVVGLFLESVGYGIFLVSFFPCMRALLFQPSGFKLNANIHWPMVIVALLLATFASMDVAYGLLHNIQAFIEYKGPGGAAEEFSDISNWVNIMKSVDVFLPICIGDLVLIYRCWVVYARSFWVVLVPFLIWMGTTACAIVLTVIEANFHAHDLLLASKFRPFLTAFCIVTIIQNIITTGLIIYRIRRVDRENAQFRYTNSSARTPSRPSRLQSVMRIVIESGLLYTAFAFMSFCTYITNSNAFYCTTDMEVQVIAIAFNLIIIRARNQTRDEYTLPSATMGSIPLHSFKAGGSAVATTVTAADQKSQMTTMHVTVMKETDTNYSASRLSV